MKVVLDANIFISFLLTKGKTIFLIIKFWQEKRFVLLVSETMLEEVEQVCQRLIEKDFIVEDEAKELLWRLRCDARLIDVCSKTSVSPDKKDNRYLVCAKDGKADYLITGDKKHLLFLGEFAGVKIISPGEFVKILKNSLV
ncbi:putative toxin-antitoxin system toxin component, PIN family [Patescibacteria group bacterium]|nr:putative toxin-antitoxin system toxin component, PIN family [Patescibacteria group bacterium]